MNVTCPECSTVYRVDPAKVPAAGVRARCAVCQAVFPVSVEPAAVGAAAPAPASAPAPAAAPAAAPAPRPAPSASPPAPPPAAPAPTPAAPVRAEPAATPAPPRPERPFAPPAVSPAARPPAAPAARPSAPTPAGAGAPPAGPRTGGAPVNPFLSQDPRQKARRLARALVSDIAVYNPEKRREALRSGRLKEAFAEEIKKSWEEYTGQVGREIADSTPFFTEALNEILAEGQAVF